jgi:hypothetical protein
MENMRGKLRLPASAVVIGIALLVAACGGESPAAAPSGTTAPQASSTTTAAPKANTPAAATAVGTAAAESFAGMSAVVKPSVTAMCLDGRAVAAAAAGSTIDLSRPNTSGLDLRVNVVRSGQVGRAFEALGKELADAERPARAGAGKYQVTPEFKAVMLKVNAVCTAIGWTG